jgi:hypothetical protein
MEEMEDAVQEETAGGRRSVAVQLQRPPPPLPAWLPRLPLLV